MFIELTDLHTGEVGLINMNIIAKIYKENEGTILIPVNSDGSEVYTVKETQEEIMQKIKESQNDNHR